MLQRWNFYDLIRPTNLILFAFVRDNEAEMIQKIAIDVSNKLNVTPSRDFEGMVGLEAHLA
jgi:hypothetical protein